MQINPNIYFICSLPLCCLLYNLVTTHTWSFHLFPPSLPFVAIFKLHSIPWVSLFLFLNGFIISFTEKTEIISRYSSIFYQKVCHINLLLHLFITNYLLPLPTEILILSLSLDVESYILFVFKGTYFINNFTFGYTVFMIIWLSVINILILPKMVHWFEIMPTQTPVDFGENWQTDIEDAKG